MTNEYLEYLEYFAPLWFTEYQVYMAPGILSILKYTYFYLLSPLGVYLVVYMKYTKKKSSRSPIYCTLSRGLVLSSMLTRAE